MQKHALDLELFLDKLWDRLVCTEGKSVPLDHEMIVPMVTAGVLTMQENELNEWVLDVNPEVPC